MSYQKYFSKNISILFKRFCTSNSPAIETNEHQILELVFSSNKVVNATANCQIECRDEIITLPPIYPGGNKDMLILITINKTTNIHETNCT